MLKREFDHSGVVFTTTVEKVPPSLSKGEYDPHRYEHTYVVTTRSNDIDNFVISDVVFKKKRLVSTVKEHKKEAILYAKERVNEGEIKKLLRMGFEDKRCNLK